MEDIYFPRTYHHHWLMQIEVQLQIFYLAMNWVKISVKGISGFHSLEIILLHLGKKVFLLYYCKISLVIPNNIVHVYRLTLQRLGTLAVEIVKIFPLENIVSIFFLFDQVAIFFIFSIIEIFSFRLIGLNVQFLLQKSLLWKESLSGDITLGWVWQN